MFSFKREETTESWHRTRHYFKRLLIALPLVCLAVIAAVAYVNNVSDPGIEVVLFLAVVLVSWCLFHMRAIPPSSRS